MRKVFETNVAFTQFSATIDGITYYNRNGRSYARKTAIPSNPNTQKQRLVRSAFTAVSSVWGTLSKAVRSSWSIAARARKISGYNLFIGENLPLVRAGRPMIISLECGMKPPVSIYAESSVSGEITCTVTRPVGISDSHITVFAVPVYRAEDEAASHRAHIAPENNSAAVSGLVPGAPYFIYALAADREFDEALSVSESICVEEAVTAGIL